uniref:Uncharacterized protein n=1 Tax=Oryza nivara TaxID=4536 RepID=A0A0E0J624_ORYNI
MPTLRCVLGNLQIKLESHDQSELGAVAALLATHGHLRDAEHEMAIRVRHRVALEHAQDGHPPGDPSARVQRHRPAHHVGDELREVAGEAVGLQGERHGDVGVPTARDSARVDLGVADVGAPVGEVGVAPRGVGEGGRVGVVHRHGDEERDVELDRHGREGEARGEAGEAGGDEVGGGVADAEHREEEDQEGDGQDE